LLPEKPRIHVVNRSPNEVFFRWVGSSAYYSTTRLRPNERDYIEAERADGAPRRVEVLPLSWTSPEATTRIVDAGARETFVVTITEAGSESRSQEAEDRVEEGEHGMRIRSVYPLPVRVFTNVPDDSNAASPDWLQRNGGGAWLAINGKGFGWHSRDSIPLRLAYTIPAVGRGSATIEFPPSDEGETEIVVHADGTVTTHPMSGWRLLTAKFTR
jgi:hypothetical protein